MVNNEIIKFIFNDSKEINNSDYSWKFLKQIINANIKDFKLDVDSFRDLYIWKNGIWKNGIWNGGRWINGKWYNGAWSTGNWHDGEWLNGYWEKGIWQTGKWYNGYWKSGIWKTGVWIKGKIYNPKTKQFEPSKVSPNKCKWSLSYGK